MLKHRFTRAQLDVLLYCAYRAELLLLELAKLNRAYQPREMKLDEKAELLQLGVEERLEKILQNFPPMTTAVAYKFLESDPENGKPFAHFNE